MLWRTFAEPMTSAWRDRRAWSTRWWQIARRAADMDGCVVMVGKAGDRADVDDLRGVRAWAPAWMLDTSAHRGGGVLAGCTMALDGPVSARRPCSSAARAGNLRRSNGGKGTASGSKPAGSSVAGMTANPALDGRPRAVVLVEGLSDRLALEALARRRGRDLAADGVAVIAMHGATNLGRYLERYGPGRA
jgi:hypothetical protein